MARFEELPTSPPDTSARTLQVGTNDVGCITDLPASSESAFASFLRASKTTFVGSTGLPYHNITQRGFPVNPPSEFARLYAKPIGGDALRQDWLNKVTEHEALFLAGATPK